MVSQAFPATVFVLNIHADYQCRHAGACCTAGWHIPVEAGTVEAAKAVIKRDFESCFDGESPPPGSIAVLRHDDHGACVFYEREEGPSCALQRACGHQALPIACQRFPRIALIDARGIHVTLSHYCPTAARMLFRNDVDGIAIVANPAGAIRQDTVDGFDATGTIPPMLRPGVVTDTAVAAAWEAFVVSALGRPDGSPESGLAMVALAAERLRAWKAGSESLESWSNRALSDSAAGADGERTWTMPASAAARLFVTAVATVPQGLQRPELPPELDAIDQRHLVSSWTAMSVPIRRYLAARAFGAWTAYQGGGLRTQVAALAVSLGVVRVEAAREAERARQHLDAEMLIAAIRRADLLMVHLSSGDELVRKLGRVEFQAADAYLSSLGLLRSIATDAG